MKGTSKSGLFLMELILVIALFAISAAVCLQLFAYASVTSQKAEDLSYGSMAARSAADCYQATQGDLDAVAQLLAGTATDGGVSVGYDDTWQATAQDATYTLELTAQNAQATIVVCQADGTEIFTLTALIPGGDVQ